GSGAVALPEAARSPRRERARGGGGGARGRAATDAVRGVRRRGEAAPGALAAAAAPRGARARDHVPARILRAARACEGGGGAPVRAPVRRLDHAAVPVARGAPLGLEAARRGPRRPVQEGSPLSRRDGSSPRRGAVLCPPGAPRGGAAEAVGF